MSMQQDPRAAAAAAPQTVQASGSTPSLHSSASLDDDNKSASSDDDNKSAPSPSSDDDNDNDNDNSKALVPDKPPPQPAQRPPKPQQQQQQQPVLNVRKRCKYCKHWYPRSSFHNAAGKELVHCRRCMKWVKFKKQWGKAESVQAKFRACWDVYPEWVCGAVLGIISLLVVVVWIWIVVARTVAAGSATGRDGVDGLGKRDKDVGRDGGNEKPVVGVTVTAHRVATARVPKVMETFEQIVGVEEV